MSMRARFLWVFIIALAIAALSATTALAMPNLGDTGWQIFASSLVFAGYLLGAMLCAIVIERRRLRAVMFIAIAGYVAAFVATWALIWFPSSYWSMWIEEEFVGKTVLSITLVSVSLTAIGLLRLLKLVGKALRLTRVTTEAVFGAFSAFSIMLLWEVFETLWYISSDMEMRFWSGLLILSIAGLLGTPALRAVEIARRKDAAESGLPMRIEVRLTCPRCEFEQSMTTGGAMCGQCGLSIKVEVEEPQCQSCGYSLAKLDAETCPECGVDIHRAIPG